MMYYNKKIHSRIRQTPYDVYYKNIIPIEHVTLNKKIKIIFKVDDYVRISKIKKMFEKGSTTNWSKEVFKITSIDDNDSPVMFQLEDLDGEEITGKFYQQELQKSELPHFQQPTK